MIVADVAGDGDTAGVELLIEDAAGDRVVQRVLKKIRTNLAVDEETAFGRRGVNAGERHLKLVLEGATERIERSRRGNVVGMRTEVADRGADMEIPAADVQVREIRSSLYPGKRQLGLIVTGDGSRHCIAKGRNVGCGAGVLGGDIPTDGAGPDAAALLIWHWIGRRADERGALSQECRIGGIDRRYQRTHSTAGREGEKGSYATQLPGAGAFRHGGR